MSEQKHTPLPWKAGPYSSIVGIAISAQPDPNKNRVVVAGTTGAFSDDHKGEHEANAALIVRAVNSHEALVKALEEIDHASKIIMDAVLQTRPDYGPEISSALCKVFDAVDRAKGENNE